MVKGQYSNQARVYSRFAKHCQHTLRVLRTPDEAHPVRKRASAEGYRLDSLQLGREVAPVLDLVEHEVRDVILVVRRAQQPPDHLIIALEDFFHRVNA